MLSTDHQTRIREITEFLSNNSNYGVGHQRGAVKGVLPAKIQEELSKNSISEFPASGNDEQKMMWRLDSTGFVFENISSGKRSCSVRLIRLDRFPD